MSKSVVGELMPLVEKAREGGIALIEALEKECPLVVKELLAWEFWSSLILCVICLSFIIVSLCAATNKDFIKRIRAAENMPDGDMGPGEVVVGWMGPIASLTIFGICFIVDLFDVIKVMIAPRVWLLEYINDMVRSLK